MWFANINKALSYGTYFLKFNTNEAIFSASSNYMSNDSGVNINNALRSMFSDGKFYTNIQERISLHHRYLDKVSPLPKMRSNA